jgi:hypothetical protein
MVFVAWSSAIIIPCLVGLSLHGAAIGYTCTPFILSIISMPRPSHASHSSSGSFSNLWLDGEISNGAETFRSDNLDLALSLPFYYASIYHVCVVF